ncbi:hypothetical protein KSS87_000041 [Heliosperma pusillum]|nr:hypothetical protein KSS87_000041 [Heliosperma pusillum]
MADLTDDVSSLLNTLLQNSSHPSTSSGPQPGGSGLPDPVAVGLFESDFGFSGGYYSGGVGVGVPASLGFDLDDINRADWARGDTWKSGGREGVIEEDSSGGSA